MEPLLENKEGLIIGYCAHAGIVDLRLSSLDGDILSETELQNLADTCREALGEDFVCQGDRTLAEVIFRELRSLDKTLAVAESCTGGLLSSQFTEIAGISKVFHGGAVCYHNDAKVQMVEVPESMLEQHGAVSEEVAIAMATGDAKKFGADYGLSVTGFAGPGRWHSDFTRWINLSWLRLTRWRLGQKDSTTRRSCIQPKKSRYRRP